MGASGGIYRSPCRHSPMAAVSANLIAAACWSTVPGCGAGLPSGLIDFHIATRARPGETACPYEAQVHWCCVWCPVIFIAAHAVADAQTMMFSIRLVAPGRVVCLRYAGQPKSHEPSGEHMQLYASVVIVSCHSQRRGPIDKYWVGPLLLGLCTEAHGVSSGIYRCPCRHSSYSPLILGWESMTSQS